MITDTIEKPRPGHRAQRAYGWMIFRRNHKLQDGDVIWLALTHTMGHTKRAAVAQYDAQYIRTGEFKRDQRKGLVRALAVEVRTY